MPSANFCFLGELIEFLPNGMQLEEITVTFKGHETVKHLVESLGVPHTEIDVILVNGVSVDFGSRLEDGDQVVIYPTNIPLDDPSIIHLQQVFDERPCFVIDGHLGKLASYLRLLGFDTIYRNDFEDDELAEISFKSDRILLTRDRGLLKRNKIRHGYCVRSKSPQKQVVEILRRFDLTRFVQPFSRCGRCNGLLIPVEKEDVIDRLEPKTKLYYDDFMTCANCSRIYWKGSHFTRLDSKLQELVKLSNK
jgi:uncharacterized protein with PIN domain